MSTLQKGFTAIEVALTIALVSVIGVAGYIAYQNHQQAPKSVSVSPSPSASPRPSVSPASRKTISASLGTEFTLHEGQTAEIGDTGLEITVLEFYNSPCPPKGQCFWTGLGVGLQYRLGDKTEKGIGLTRAFGYHADIIKTDYKTYANLVVEKL